MPETDLQRLLKRIDRYLKRSGMTRTAFGRAVAGTPNLLTRLEVGDVKFSTYERVRRWLDQVEE